jgi:hypothetical protein
LAWAESGTVNPLPPRPPQFSPLIAAPLFPNSRLFGMGSNQLLLLNYSYDLRTRIRGFSVNLAGSPSISVLIPQVELPFSLLDVSWIPGPATCPADFNNDGGTDGDDVIAFFARWDSNC